MSEATLDQFTDNGVIQDNTSGVLLRKKKASQKEKRLHLILKGDSISRLENLQSVVYPPTQTEVVTTAMQLLETFVEEYKAGSKFYIKREGNLTPEEYKIFD